MPLLKVEAEKLSNNQLEAGVIEELIERDDLFAVMPFMQVNSKAYVYNREDRSTFTAGRAGFKDVGDTIDEAGTKFIEVITKLRILIGDVDIDKFLQETQSDTTDQMAAQIAFKAKDIGRQFHDAVANGDSSVNAKEFDGIKKLVTADQTIEAGANGAALTLSMLDQLLDQVRNGADALLMRRGTLRAFRNALRAAGGTSAAEFMMPAFGRPMLTHNGVPILVSDFLPGNEAAGTNPNTCSVYAVRLNEADGLHGLWGGSNGGIRLESVGTVQNKDADRMRVKWYCGLALKSTQSLARLSGVTNV